MTSIGRIRFDRTAEEHKTARGLIDTALTLRVWDDRLWIRSPRRRGSGEQTLGGGSIMRSIRSGLV
ncbi:MAG: hypothetical protein ACRERC_19055, partial [Candidatus Binatia bacterium]